MLTINEDLLGPEAIDDPYKYYGRLREEDPIHWSPLYETWVITRYDDVVWFLRHPELFSSEIFLRDDRPPFPPILDTDHALYEFNKKYLSHWFIRRDAPDHLRMRRVVHPHFNPKYIEGRFRTLVREVIHDLVAEVEARGHMEVLQDFAAPLPVLVIAQWLGLPQPDRQFIRHPDHWEQLKRDSALIERATEEILRYDAPVKRAPRIAAANVERREKTIRKAERVLLILSAANRDPRQFSDPDTFDITRHPNP